MSVLYPIKLKKNFTQYSKSYPGTLVNFLILFVITCFFTQVTVAQEQEKAEVVRKSAELKELEAKKLEEKIKANPGYFERISRSADQPSGNLQISEEDQKKKNRAEEIAELAEANRKKAKELLEAQGGPSLPGVEYKVYLNAQHQVEYQVTNAGNVIYRQQVITAGDIYERKVQAEKEAIYAYNTFRRNPAYPVDALQVEIRSLFSQLPIRLSPLMTTRTQNTLADITFNGGGGSIPGTGTTGPASPYPSTITVSGVPTGSTVKSVTINGLNHTWPDDIDMVLQSPTGTNVILMSDVGGGTDLVNVNFTFSDGAAQQLSDGGPLSSGTYQPTNIGTGDNWPAPGPGTAPSAITLATFGNGNHNGTWSLFIYDDVSGDSGDWGSWSITFTEPAAGCSPITISSHPANTTACPLPSPSSVATFSVTAGPAGITYNWQEDRGSGFAYLSNGGVYSGVNTATLTLTGVTSAMNGYRYRCVLICATSGLPEISNAATLTVSPPPPAAPVISPTSGTICPGGSQQFNVVNTTSFSNTANIVVPGTGSGSSSGSPANPYPSTINVSGLPVGATLKAVVINGISHTFFADIDILLQSPGGTNVVLMSDVGSSTNSTSSPRSYTFDDAAATTLSTSNPASLSGTYRPTNNGATDNWAAPLPASITQASPALSMFGTENNGTWNLFVVDDVGGDIGNITGGWSLVFDLGGVATAIFSPATGLFTDATLMTPYTAGAQVSTVYAAPAATTTYSAYKTDGTCLSQATNFTVTVNTPPAITVQPSSNGNVCVGGNRTFSVTATGSGLTYQWQVDAGSGFSNITTTANNPSGFIYSGQTTNTLSINTIMATMNNYKYRCIVSGACPPSQTSNEVTLVVNSLPVISVVKSAGCAPSTLTATGANTFTWSPSGGLSATSGASVTANPTSNTVYTVTGTSTATGCSATSQVDVQFTPPAPVVTPAAPVICLNTVQPLSITSSSLPPVANTTSSGNISVPVSHTLPPSISSLNVSGITGAIQSMSVNFNITHTWDGDLTINLRAPNGSILNLVRERGGPADNFINTTISSTATTPIASGSAPFTGAFLPDALNGVGITPYQSNVTTFGGLFSIPNGTWDLIMTDPWIGDDGTLTSWSITINYAAPDAGIWTPVTGLFSNAAGTTPYVAGTPATTVYAAPAATATYSVNVTNTSKDKVAFSSGGSVTLASGAPASTAAGAGGPYPSTITVSGLPVNAIVKQVRLKGIRHSWSDDLDILLQSPTGTNVILMSDVGGGNALTGITYTFDDSGNPMSTSLNATGTYRPTNFGTPETFPAPIGSVNQASPALSMFTGDPNGTWNLFAADDVGGDVGMITAWEIIFELPDNVNCTSPTRNVTVTVNNPVVFTTQPQSQSVCVGSNVIFTVAATGTQTTTQWQLSTNGGTTWTDISGANSNTLTLNNVTTAMSGYRYRCVKSNQGCGPVNSNAAILTVNPLPTVTLSINPTGQTQLQPGMFTTITVNSTPAAASYEWFVNGLLQPGITGSSYTVSAFTTGTYSVRVRDVNNCVNTSAGLKIDALPSDNLFIFPNPATNVFSVSYYRPTVGSSVTIRIFDMNGKTLLERYELTTSPYSRYDFNASTLASGVYIIEIRDLQGRRLERGRLVVTR